MKTSSAKAKGRRLQQAVASAILALFPRLEADDVRPAVMGESGEDVKLSPAARRAFPYSIECKNVERLNVWSALDQAQKNAGAHTPLVVIKKNRTMAYAVVPFDHFMGLLRSMEEMRG